MTERPLFRGRIGGVGGGFTLFHCGATGDDAEACEAEDDAGYGFHKSMFLGLMCVC